MIPRKEPPVSDRRAVIREALQRVELLWPDPEPHPKPDYDALAALVEGWVRPLEDACEMEAITSGEEHRRIRAGAALAALPWRAKETT